MQVIRSVKRLESEATINHESPLFEEKGRRLRMERGFRIEKLRWRLGISRIQIFGRHAEATNRPGGKGGVKGVSDTLESERVERGTLFCHQGT